MTAARWSRRAPRLAERNFDRDEVLLSCNGHSRQYSINRKSLQTLMTKMAIPPRDHQTTLEKIVANSALDRSPKRLFGQVGDDFWFWLFTEGYRENRDRLDGLLPSMPDENIQRRFTGAAGNETLTEAFSFYLLVRRLATTHLDRSVESVLDFGCGWGRAIRFFLRDIEPRNLWGIDCFPQMIDLCKTTNVWSNFALVEPLPPTTFYNGTFDLVYAYSVFSHLSERAHLAWLHEFKRILRPGGLVVATTRPREFIQWCADLRANQDQQLWAKGPASSFTNTKEALARYDRGEFLYESVGGGDCLDPSFFGETCIPRRYVEENWTKLFTFVDYIDDRSACIQNVILVRK